MLCETFGIDPLEAIAEGSLPISAGPDRSKAILHKSSASGIEASVIGKVTRDPKTKTIKRRDGMLVLLAIPAQDPFWPVFLPHCSPLAMRRPTNQDRLTPIKLRCATYCTRFAYRSSSIRPVRAEIGSKTQPDLFFDHEKVAILAFITSHICDSDDVPTTRRRAWLPMKWCMLKKKKCVTEVGCDEYKTSLCESFSMCDYVTFKVWNKKTKRWDL